MNLLEFLFSIFESLVTFSRSVIDMWDDSLADILAQSPISDIPLLGWVVDSLGRIDLFETLTLGGLALGSVAFVISLTIFRWVRGN